MNVGFWLARPRLIVPRLRYWMWERQNPEKPWLCAEAIEYCEQHLTPSMQGLEFGSGRSTAWFAGHLGRLTSVEHYQPWYERVKADLAKRGASNVDYRFVPLGHPQQDPERDSYNPLPRYVAVLDDFQDESLDLIVIDGHYRTTCIRHCLRKLRPGGFLLVDDLNLWRPRTGLPVPSDWSQVHESTNLVKQTGIWQKPSISPA